MENVIQSMSIKQSINKNPINIKISQDLRVFLQQNKKLKEGIFETYDDVIRRLTNMDGKGGFLE